MPESRWQGLEVVEVVECIESEAFAVRIGLKRTVVGTTTGSSSAVASTVYTRGSPRSYPVVVAAVVEVGNVAHIAEHIGATVVRTSFGSDCNFGHTCPTLAGYLKTCNKMPSDSD